MSIGNDFKVAAHAITIDGNNQIHQVDGFGAKPEGLDANASPDMKPETPGLG